MAHLSSELNLTFKELEHSNRIFKTLKKDFYQSFHQFINLAKRFPPLLKRQDVVLRDLYWYVMFLGLKSIKNTCFRAPETRLLYLPSEQLFLLLCYHHICKYQLSKMRTIQNLAKPSSAWKSSNFKNVKNIMHVLHDGGEDVLASPQPGLFILPCLPSICQRLQSAVTVLIFRWMAMFVTSQPRWVPNELFLLLFMDCCVLNT